MSFFSIVRINAMLLSIIALTMAIPVVVAISCSEFAVIPAFLLPMGICIIIGVILFFAGERGNFTLSFKGGFAAVASCWVFASLLGAIPFVISGTIPSFTDAFFESASGFTTTGATILSNIEILPRSINLWRTQMHWLGGMGIVALTVALLPLLGVGGFQLIKAETTGPEKGKITPKITMTAKILWFIYFGLTLLQTGLLCLTGMDFIDSLSHAFATLGTGGFSTQNASVGGFNKPAVDWICTVFMILAGVNFSLYFRVLQGKGKEVFQNSEFKAYVGILVISILAITISITPVYGNFITALRYAAFQASSIMTTTGFTTADYALWPGFAQMILFFLMFVGGCSGSTGGSIKVIRWVVLGKQMHNEMQRMLHPHGVYNIRLNSRAGRKDVVFSVSGFFFLYFMLVAVTAMVASLNNIDILSSFTASLAMVGNIGPGFGKVGPVENYGFFNGFTKWWFSFAMIAGRLELYTMLIFLTPSYWKK